MDSHWGDKAQQPVPTTDDYMTPGEAARTLHVSPKTINRWANEGRIPCIITLGGHRRFRRHDIEATVQSMSAKGAALSS
jgi:excisionase family DNA binding protein